MKYSKPMPTNPMSKELTNKDMSHKTCKCKACNLKKKIKFIKIPKGYKWIQAENGREVKLTFVELNL